MTSDPNTTARVLVVGESLIDIVHHPDGSSEEYPGGSPMNVAIGLARLGHPVQLATMIGTDERGRAISAHVERDHVTLTPGSTAAPATATAAATLDESGSADYEFDLTGQLPPLQVDTDHLHTGSIAAVLQPGGSAVREAIEAARATTTISYDPNARPAIMGTPDQARADVEQLIGLADVVKASDEDIAWFYDGAEPEVVLPLWGKLGPSVVIATRGGDGALVYLRTQDATFSVPGIRTEVADTVGAGDAFMAGLVSGLLDAGLLGGEAQRAALRGADEAQVRPAVERAIRTSSITVSRPGANPPTRDEI